MRKKKKSSGAEKKKTKKRRKVQRKIGAKINSFAGWEWVEGGGGEGVRTQSRFCPLNPQLVRGDRTWTNRIQHTRGDRAQPGEEGLWLPSRPETDFLSQQRDVLLVRLAHIHQLVHQTSQNRNKRLKLRNLLAQRHVRLEWAFQ